MRVRTVQGWSLIELITTMAIVGILAGSFVSLFVPQVMLFLFLPNEIRVQIAANDAMVAMVEGDPVARGLKYAEPDTVAKEVYANHLGNTTRANYTPAILYADHTRLRYGYHDLSRNFHTVELALDQVNHTLTRQVDGGAVTIFSSGGASGTGGIRIYPVNIINTGPPTDILQSAVFRYYDVTKAVGPTDTGTEFTEDVIAPEDLNRIWRVSITFKANTGNSQVMSGQAEILKKSSVKIPTFFFPDSGEWEFSFFNWPGDNIPDLLAVKKNPTHVRLFVWGGDKRYSADDTTPILDVTLNSLTQRGDNYTYLMADCAASSTIPPDGTPDLVEIKKSDTSTTRQIEVSIYDGSRNFGALLRPTALLPIEVPNGYEQYDFGVADRNNDGYPDLCVMYKGINGVTVSANYMTTYFYNGKDFTSLGRAAPKSLGIAANNNWNFFVYKWNADAYPDLVAIRKKGSTSVLISVFGGTAYISNSSFTDFGSALSIDSQTLSNVSSAFPPLTLNNIDFGVGDWGTPGVPGDGHPDILWVQRNQTDSGVMEVHALSNYISGVSQTSFNNTVLEVNTALDEVSDGKSVS